MWGAKPLTYKGKFSKSNGRNDKMYYIINAIENIINYMKHEGIGIAGGAIIASITVGILLGFILLLIF